ncbi:MAG: Cell division transporter, ATP-binding protein FtsE [Anaerolineae bacterium]|jgi:putative ABC transport system ATP-binding protein|nr:MAG: Cell division transporter, ATP-binding protein FtsE [Anaerolineae bacterium]
MVSEIGKMTKIFLGEYQSNQSELSLVSHMESDSASIPLMEAQDLWKVYQTPSGDVPALKGIDLSIQAGEFLIIVGKSGAGKSTLVNLLTTIDVPTKGRLFFRGKSVLDLSEEERTRWRGKNLGIVFQFFQLFPTLTIWENVKISMDLLGELPVQERKERALDLLRQVGLEDHARKVPAKISGGQQQRVAIARALANDPPLLIADEPTGNLDSRTSEEIMELFASFVSRGKSVLMVTHDRGALKWATRVVEILDGELQR